MDWPLYWRLPAQGEASTEKILDQFLDYVTYKDLTLYPAQEEAILELFEGKNIVLNTPTGSGKSLVALAVHFQSLALGRRSVYTCPIKALVNEKFRDLCRDFGPDQVGMITGDASVNPGAPILCCTAEILANRALREGEHLRVDDIIMDEFHYYSDKQRGAAWQIPLLTLKKSRFLLMSATLGDMDFFIKSITKLTNNETLLVSSQDRPVPLDFEYCETPIHETIGDMVKRGLAPIYLVNFSQREAADEAQNLLSVDFSTKEEKKKIAELLLGFHFHSPYGKEFQKVLRHGIGIHHAGLLPKYRNIVEKLAQQGLLKVISGTDTLGVGVNVPIRSVLFTKLCKYDGIKTAILSVRDFQQISGRAGRRGFDTRGTVAAQAPAHVIENNKQKSKAANDPKKLRKLVMKTPPPKGFVMWTAETFQKLQSSTPEPLVSSFSITHGMLLNVLSREEDGCKAMQQLIHDSHETQKSKKLQLKLSFKFFRALLERKIIEFIEPPPDSGRKIKVHADLQDDFSLNQTLSLYLLDAIQVLEPQSPLYALDLLTLVEAILENPETVLRKQLDRLKSEKMFELKLAGVEFDERIEELEKLEHPKPNRDFIYTTFNIFLENHPWISEEGIRPKSVAREMYENFHTFAEYIREYSLQRSEGQLLRYLSDVYKVLEQNVPMASKTEPVLEIIAYFSALLKAVDSSLVEEWEKLRQASVWSTQTAALSSSASGETTAAGQSGATTDAKLMDPTLNKKLFTIAIRNSIFLLLRALAMKDYETACEQLSWVAEEESLSAKNWSELDLEKALTPYYEEHQRVCTDPKARAAHNTKIVEEGETLRIKQILVDPEEISDWEMECLVHLPATRKLGIPALELIGIGPVTGYA